MIAALLLAGWVWDGGSPEPTPTADRVVKVYQQVKEEIQVIPPTDPPDTDIHVSILSGAMVGIATESDSTVEPFVHIGAKVPLSADPQAPRLHASIDLTNSPGEAVALEDPWTWKAVEVAIGVSAYPVAKLNVGLWAEGGFSSKLPGDAADPQPRYKAARWAYGGVIFDKFKNGSLKLGIGGDQRLDGTYQAAVTLKGWISLYQAEKGFLKGSMVALVGDAVLGINLSNYYPGLNGGLHDVIRVGLTAGWGK